MRTFWITLMILGCSAFTYATEQENDIVVYKGHKGQLDVMLQISPLLDYYRIHQEKKYPFEMISTANYRGHTATWEIKNGRLALLDITRRDWHLKDKEIVDEIETIPLSTLFEEKVVNGKVKADWFSGFVIVEYEEAVLFWKSPQIAIVEFRNGKMIAEHSYKRSDFYKMLWKKIDMPANDKGLFVRCFPPDEAKGDAPAAMYTESNFSLFLRRYINGQKHRPVLIPLTEFCIIKNAAVKTNPPGWIIAGDIIPADNSNLLVLEMGSSNVPEGAWSKYSPGAIQLVIQTDIPTQGAIDLSSVKTPGLYSINNHAEFESLQSVLGTVEVMNKDESNVILTADITLKSYNPVTLQEIKINNAVIPVYTLEQYNVEYHKKEDIAAVIEKHKICQKYNAVQSDNK